MSFDSWAWDHELKMRSDYSYRVQFEDENGVIRDPLDPPEAHFDPGPPTADDPDECPF